MPEPELVTFSRIAGVPFHYARPPLAPYGSRGKPYNFRCQQPVIDALDGAMADLARICPLGAPEVVTSAGTFVNKPGQHGNGLAIDIDAIFWSAHDFVTNYYPADPVFYLSVEAIFRRHFGLGLNYLYNSAHHDHLHLDLSIPVSYQSGSRSATLFLQASLTHVHETAVVIDGLWGKQTQSAAEAVLKGLGMSGKITSASTWKAYLEKTASHGFERAQKAVDTFSGRIATVSSVIEHLDLEGSQWRLLRGTFDDLLGTPEISHFIGDGTPFEDFRLEVAKKIVEFEARRDAQGKLKVYKLPATDGGGDYEVAGINVKYHPEMAARLRKIIEKDKDPDQAEKLAALYIATYTDAAPNWCHTRAVEAFLRDSIWNRGPTGAARILQIALRFKKADVDGIIGPMTRAAVATAENDLPSLLQKLRDAREAYERAYAKRDENHPLWKGLVNRWKKALKMAESYA